MSDSDDQADAQPCEHIELVTVYADRERRRFQRLLATESEDDIFLRIVTAPCNP